MKKFEIEMDVHFTKTIHIEAPDEDAATVLAETMLLYTDALPLTDEDMVGLITTATELGVKPVRKTEPADEDEEDEQHPAGANGKPMSLDELMLHLAMYIEDAEDELDDVQATLSSIEKFARAILKAKSTQESVGTMSMPTI